MMAADKEENEWQQLPSFHEIVQRFSLFSTSASCNPQVGSGGSLDCRCQGCMDWHAFVEGTPSLCKEIEYEVFTKEHVKGLAHYLLLQAAEYKLSVMKVLEVGAGSGRLSHHLNQFLDEISLVSKDCVVHVTASDSGERGLNGPNVILQDALESVTEGSPHVVLVSWMPTVMLWPCKESAAGQPRIQELIPLLVRLKFEPIFIRLRRRYTQAVCFYKFNSIDFGTRFMLYAAQESGECQVHVFSCPMGVDWTAHMRATPSVLEYILIGEMDDGICGDPWLTWGYRPGDFSSDSSLDPSSPETVDLEFRSTCEHTSGASFSNYGPGRAAVIVESESTSEEIEGSNLNMRSVSLLDTKIEETPSEPPRPYETDGWVRIELQNLSQFQICRTDERWSTLRHSHTVSFRRLSSSN